MQPRRTATTKKQNRSKKWKNNALSDGNSDLSGIHEMRLTRPLAVQFPDKLRVRLNFTEFLSPVIAIGSSFSSQRFRPTNVFDVDPVLGSTAVPGFQEMANIYATYRTVKSDVFLQMSQNGNQSAVSVVCVPLNVDPGASPSSTVVSSWYGAFGNKSALMPQIGGPAITIRNTMTTERIFGTKAVYFDDNFAAPVSGGPTNNWYWAIGVNSAGNASGTAITTSGRIQVFMDVEFFNRLLVTT
jgi:hypothetical protein